MAYVGKFIDRSPIICAAGLPRGDPSRSVAQCFSEYKLADEVTALQHEAGIFEEHKEHITYSQPKLKNYRHCGLLSEIKTLLTPPVTTRYQTLINDLKETSYESYWNKLLGKCCDPLPGLPKGMDPIATTFGTPTDRSCTVKELVNPPKTPYQVSWDSQVGHDLYKRSHNDYNPGEQVNRRYLQPPFDPKKRYGEHSLYDPRGIWAKCACTWFNTNPISTVYSLQADSKELRHPKIGEVLAPNQNIDCLPKGHAFGDPTKRPLFGIGELLRDADCEPSVAKIDFYEWVSVLNQLRNYLKRRSNKSDFDFKEFHDRNLYFDTRRIGWLPLEIFNTVCKCFGVNYEKEALEPLLRHLEIIQDDYINYRDFIHLSDLNTSLPELIKIDDVPKKNQYYITTSKAANCDFLTIDNSQFPKAGAATFRSDKLQPNVPEGGCLADLENLGEETRVAHLVNPSIYTNYGLTYRDFLMPRNPDVMRSIFEKIGYEFPEDTFQKLWNEGVERDKTGMVCVETFKKLIKESLPPHKLIVKDVMTC